MSERPLTRDELVLLLKIVQVFEASYFIDDPQYAMEVMQRQFEKTLLQYGAELAPDLGTRERVYRLGVRIRQALGEDLNDDGSPV